MNTSLDYLKAKKRKKRWALISSLVEKEINLALPNEFNRPGAQLESDSLIQNINACQAKIERIHYEHFIAIKNICRDDQLPAFEELTIDLAKLFSPPHPPRHKR